MKKYIAVLLCLVMVLPSLISCGIIREKPNVPSEPEGDGGIENSQDTNVWGGILDLYAKVLTTCGDYGLSVFEVENVVENLDFQSDDEKQLFSTLITSIRDDYRFLLGNRYYTREPLCHFGYVIKDFNNDGTEELILLNDGAKIFAVFSQSEEGPKLLWFNDSGKDCWFDENGLFYTGTLDFQTIAGVHRIYQITSNGSLELLFEFGDLHCVPAGNPLSFIRYELVNGEKKIITEEEYQSLLEEHILSHPYSGDNAVNEYIVPFFTRIFSDSDFAKILMDAALNNDEDVYNAYDAYGGALLSLQYIPQETGYFRLSDIGPLYYTFCDMDKDGIEEAVINCGESMLVLRYYEGRIYRYHISAHSINTDGSYGWRYNGQPRVYGENKIVFDSAELNTVTLWQAVNDGEPNAEYYIGDQQVTQEELLKYIEDNPKTPIEFSPLEASWINQISHSEAITIAEEYWKDFDIEGNGYRIEHGYNSWAQGSVYVMVIQRYEVDHYSTFDEIWINKNTGETITPHKPEAKG